MRQRPMHAAGFSLVELMVSLVVALVVMAGALRVFIGMRESFGLEDAMSRMQENGRYAAEALAVDARQAGFTGCITTINNMLNTGGANYVPALYDVTRPLTGFEFTGTAIGDTYDVATLLPTSVATSNWADDTGTALPGLLQDAVLPGTDVLMVKRADQRLLATTTTGTPQNSATITLNAAVTDPAVMQHAIVLVSDCVGADLFQNRGANSSNTLSRATTAGPGPGNIADDFSHPYVPGIEVYMYSATAYYIGTGASGEPSLFRRRFPTGGTGAAEELVEGVENFQVLFGEDTGADRVADVYVEADNVTDWARVVSLKVGFLMRTPQDSRIDPDTATYNLLGTTINPLDQRRVRRVLTWTVALRNRLS